MYFTLISLFFQMTKLNILKLQHVYLILRIRGGGDARPKLDREMGVAVGGFIDQAVVRDPGTHNWITMHQRSNSQHA